MTTTTPTTRTLMPLSAAAALLIQLAATTAQAADLPPVPPPAPAPTRPASQPAAQAPVADPLAQARYLTRSLQWSAALDELKRVNATGSADWHNLMGYTLRHGKVPDLVAAGKHYDQALRIDPRHRNTLEYSGELYLMKGQLGKAQGRLAALSGECGATGCQQHAQLQAAIDRYKAAGNKFVPTTW